jgi:hypothetical protein
MAVTENVNTSSLLEDMILEEIKDAEWVMVGETKTERLNKKRIVKWDIDSAIKRLEALRRELKAQ